MSLLDSPGGGGFQNPVATLLPGQVTSADIADGAVTSIKIASHLQSDNWNGTTVAAQDATAGWRIERNTGSIGLAGDVFVGGNVTLDGSGFIQTNDGGNRVQLNAGNAYLEIYNSTDDLVAYIGANVTGFATDQIVFAGDVNTTGGGMVLTSGGAIVIEPFEMSGVFIKTDATLDGPLTFQNTAGTTYAVFGGSSFYRWQIETGDATEPAYSFFGDTDTGIFRAATNAIGFTAGGAESMRISSIGLFSNAGTGAPIVNSAIGSATNPAFTFVGDDNTGIYRATTDTLGFVSAGTMTFALGTNFVAQGGTGSAQIQGGPGTESSPAYTFVGDTDNGFYRASANQINWAAAGQENVRFQNIASGTVSVMFLRDGLTDVGNHETLRLNRGTGTTMQAVGYFSSWIRDPDTGRIRKTHVKDLDRSPLWNREWYRELRPVSFKRKSTGEHELGFALDHMAAVDPGLRYLTTKGDRWGYSPDDTALIAVTVLEVQDLLNRIEYLERILIES